MVWPNKSKRHEISNSIEEINFHKRHLHFNAQTAQTSTAGEEKETVKNSGYCENCRVKYESLEQHIVS
ncbi:CFC_HP_G0025150.mRNA.1.CDS.1 [Saccharomyces cerevisiae]|nr:CFC_HP_G0025150.mRNA.1.CDS.1 [Saccharomyces cerevisiae]CAI6944683.1 CFC_HP_G0025150.mRNA.1.CDS.1 [Saccharomyces cerevisiae]